MGDNMAEIKCDVAILGGGPAGLTAAIYCARYNLNTVIIEKDQWGGKLNIIHDLVNYPGFNAHDGSLLATTMVQQVNDLGVTMINESMDDVEINETIILRNGSTTVIADDLILACGSKPVRSSIENASKFIGHGVSFCATCDAMFFKGKHVAVYGDNALAVKEATHLSHIVEHVSFVTPLDHNDPMVDGLNHLDNVTLIDHGKIIAVHGMDHVESVEIQTTNGLTTLNVSALFPYEQAEGSLQFLKVYGIQNANGFITVDDKMATYIPHVYAIGDIVVKPLRQVVTATHDGAVAALSVFESHHKG